MLPAQETNASVSPRLYKLYRFAVQFISADGHVVQLLTTPRNNNIGSASAINAVPSIRDVLDRVQRQIGAAPSGLFGYLAFSYDINTVSSADLQRIIPIVAVLIAFLLALEGRLTGTGGE